MISLTAASTSSLRWLIVAIAPRSRATASTSSREAVAITRAPSAEASVTAALPTPEPAPHTSTHSPGCRRARVISMRQAVANTSGYAAASAKLSGSGFGWRLRTGTTQ